MSAPGALAPPGDAWPPRVEDVTVVVLAGGLGTRIRALHPDVPKPLVPVAGRPFLHWLTAYLARFGLADFVYATGHLGDQIEAWTAERDMPGIARRVCREPRPLGTGGGLLHCLDLCRGWVLVSNGDSLCLGGVADLLALRGRDGLAGGLVGILQDETSRFGSLAIDPATGELAAFREKVPGRGYVNAGLYLFRADALRAVATEGPTSIERDLVPAMLRRHVRLGVITLEAAPFIDIGTPETVAAATAFVESHGDCFA